MLEGGFTFFSCRSAFRAIALFLFLLLLLLPATKKTCCPSSAIVFAVAACLISFTATLLPSSCLLPSNSGSFLQLPMTSPSAPPPCTPRSIYFERQERMQCLVHSLNNLLQRRAFTAADLNAIAYSVTAAEGGGWRRSLSHRWPLLGNAL